jgi:hypothetical protein
MWFPLVFNSIIFFQYDLADSGVRFQRGKISYNVSAPDAVAAWELIFFYFRKNENRKIKSQITENQRLSLTRVIAGFCHDTRADKTILVKYSISIFR